MYGPDSGWSAPWRANCHPFAKGSIYSSECPKRLLFQQSGTLYDEKEFILPPAEEGIISYKTLFPNVPSCHDVSPA